MTRKLSFLAVALTLIVGSAFAQEPTGSYPQQTNATTQQAAPSDQATTDPAATPAQTDPSTMDETGTMPATASVMPLIGMTGLGLLLAAVGLRIRRKRKARVSR